MWSTSLSEYGRIRRLALRRPAESFVDQARVDSEWKRLNYTARPNYAGAQSQYDRLVKAALESRSSQYVKEIMDDLSDVAMSSSRGSEGPVTT